MSTLIEDHETFKQLTSRKALYLIQNHPGLAEEDWLCQSFQSLDRYAEYFPTAVERQRVNETIAETAEQVERAKEWAKAAFDLSLDVNE